MRKIPGYQNEFRRAFPDDAEPLSYDNLASAIASFERSLISRAAFDTYLMGDEGALGDQAKRGLRTFVAVGCVTCHAGALLGGTAFKKFGVHDDYWKYTGSKVIDKGRFEVTAKEKDRYRFKVPTLRNVAHTAPYFHDGSVAELSRAVAIMAKIQRNVDLSAEQTADIVAFLESLTGDIPAGLLTAPELPPGAFVP